MSDNTRGPGYSGTPYEGDPRVDTPGGPVRAAVPPIISARSIMPPRRGSPEYDAWMAARTWSAKARPRPLAAIFPGDVDGSFHRQADA